MENQINPAAEAVVNSNINDSNVGAGIYKCTSRGIEAI